MDLKKLFAPAQKSTPVQMSASIADAYDQSLTYNPDNRLAGETYDKYGTRICALVNGSVVLLAAFLQRIYSQEKVAQANNQKLQDQLKEKLQQEKAQAEAKLEKTNNNIDLIKDKIAKINDNIVELKNKISELKGKANELNKGANAKMILGVIILLPLTIYLTTFYSSTFYSAFFKDFTAAANIGVGAAMFDANALLSAYKEGVMELVFVISAPIIFLGLGFCLHYFMAQKGKAKYVKAAAIVAVTFAFDCILAYLIGKNIYDVNALNSLETLPPYTVGAAVKDVNTWAVIFCGFIVYIIWGLVFDMAYDGYEQRFSNKHEIEEVEIKVENENNKLAALKQEETDARNDVTDLNVKIASLGKQLTQNVLIDNGTIKSALAQFYTGWLKLMPSLNKTQKEQQDAKAEYENTMATLFPQTSNNVKIA